MEVSFYSYIFILIRFRRCFKSIQNRQLRLSPSSIYLRSFSLNTKILTQLLFYHNHHQNDKFRHIIDVKIKKLFFLCINSFNYFFILVFIKVKDFNNSDDKHIQLHTSH